MKFNLLGQRGKEGQSNPDAPEAGPYIYDTPPGLGDNKGLSTVRGQVIGPASKSIHEKKLEEAGITDEEDFSQFSFGEKEVPDVSDAVQKLSNREFNTIRSLDDIKKLDENRTFSDTQINRLKGIYGVSTINALFKGIEDTPTTTTVNPTNTRFPRNPKFTSTVEPTIPKELAIFGEDAIYVASAMKTIEDKKVPKDLASAIRLLRNYDTVEKVTTTEKEKVVKTTEEGKSELNNLLADNTISQGEFNAFSKALDTIASNPSGSEVKKDLTGGGTKTLYIVVGSPGNYTVKAVNPGDEGYESGMSLEAAQATANELNKGFLPDDTGGPTGEPTGGPAIPPAGGIQLVDLNNVPRDSYIWNVDNQLYVAYEVPGAGDVYENPPMYMAYEVYRNDLVEAGLISKDAPIPTISPIRKEDFDRVAILFSGDTNQLTQDNRNPFASFTETIAEQSQVAPWITDTEAIGLIAEAALEGREVTDAEWQSTNWYKTHNQTERDWLTTYYSDPSTATQLTTDSQIAVANSLQAAGVSDAPEALINWVAGKYVSGEWSQTYTSEQVNLFADPYATGKRDASFENYLSSTALTGVDRTTEREREVTELYNKWLGPSLGKLTDTERAEIAGRLRDDPDYQDQLVNSLKQSRLAAFSNYTNPELTYEDIARPWRNLTTSVWGQTADETQGWWQEMVKTNDFAQAQTTLREKGLEQDVTQVTTDATQALQQALGQGSVSQTGVNV